MFPFSLLKFFLRAIFFIGEDYCKKFIFVFRSFPASVKVIYLCLTLMAYRFKQFKLFLFCSCFLQYYFQLDIPIFSSNTSLNYKIASIFNASSTLKKRCIREHRQNVSGQLSGFWPLKVEGYR